MKLQKMLDICFECGSYLDIVFNAKVYIICNW